MSRGRASMANASAPRQAQRGVAMLAAILLVALGTVLAATVAYENAMTARRGTGVFAFENALAIGQGAEALAGYGLRELTQTQGGRNIYPGQGWDKPYGPLEIVPGVMLTAELEDLSGRFNLNKLVRQDTGAPDPLQVQAFAKLLEEVGLEPKWADYVVTWIAYNEQPQITDGAPDSVYMGQTPPYRAAHRYITSASELLALPVFGRERYQALAPYVTALPPDATFNVCTSPVNGKVLDAYLAPGHFEFTNGTYLKDNRQAAGGCSPTKDYYAKLVQDDSNRVFGIGKNPDIAKLFVQTSSYFRLHSRISIGSTEFDLYSLLYFQQSQARVLQRSFTPD